MTKIYLHIVARMADYMDTHPYAARAYVQAFVVTNLRLIPHARVADCWTPPWQDEESEPLTEILSLTGMPGIEGALPYKPVPRASKL